MHFYWNAHVLEKLISTSSKHYICCTFHWNCHFPKHSLTLVMYWEEWRRYETSSTAPKKINKNTRNETVAFGALIFTCTFFCFFSFHLRLGIVASSLVAFCIDATCSSVLLVRRTEHCEAGEKRVCNHYGFSLLIRQFSYQQRYKVWMINC